MVLRLRVTAVHTERLVRFWASVLPANHTVGESLLLLRDPFRGKNRFLLDDDPTRNPSARGGIYKLGSEFVKGCLLAVRRIGLFPARYTYL